MYKYGQEARKRSIGLSYFDARRETERRERERENEREREERERENFSFPLLCLLLLLGRTVFFTAQDRNCRTWSTGKLFFFFFFFLFQPGKAGWKAGTKLAC